MNQTTSPLLPKPRTAAAQAGVQSLARALDILEIFPLHGPEIGLSALASLLGLNKATTYRLLSTLEAHGYVTRALDGRKYRLGVRLFELGSYYQGQIDVRRTALPFLQAMAQQTGEAAFLCVREGDEALCIERVSGEQEVNIFPLRVGGRQALHCGAAPRALLAGLEDSELADYAARSGLPALTAYTITSLDALLQDVHTTQAQGFVLSMQDVTMGIAAVGAPVRDLTGRVSAAISLSGLVARFNPGHIHSLTEVILHNARGISCQMGYQMD